jgi:hypothetical protein
LVSCPPAADHRPAELAPLHHAPQHRVGVDHPGLALDREMQLAGPGAQQHQIARSRVRRPHQSRRLDHLDDMRDIIETQRIATRHDRHIQRQCRQPDTVEPRRRIAPVQTKPHPDRPPRGRPDARACIHAPG